MAGQRYHGTVGGILVYEKHCLFLSAGILAHRKRFLLHKCLLKLCLLIQFFSSFSGINGVFKTCSVSAPRTLIHPACMLKNFLMGHLDQPALLATYGQKYWVTYLQTLCRICTATETHAIKNHALGAMSHLLHTMHLRNEKPRSVTFQCCGS